MRNGKPQRAGRAREPKQEQKPFVNPLNPTGWRPPSIEIKRRRGSGPQHRSSGLFKLYD